MFDGRFRVEIERVVRPVGKLLLLTGLSPYHITILGLLIAIGASVAMVRFVRFVFMHSNPFHNSIPFGWTIIR